MDNSKSFLKQQGFMPRLNFKDEPLHTVELISDEVSSFKGRDGKDTEGMLYTVREDGEVKEWLTTSISAISKLAEFEEGDTISITQKKKKRGSDWIIYYEIFKNDNPKDKSGIKEVEDVNEALQGIH